MPQNPPDTLPANFDFSSTPDTLPANFDFGQQTPTPKLPTPSPTGMANQVLSRYGINVGPSPDERRFAPTGQGSQVVKGDGAFKRNALSGALAFADTQAGSQDVLPVNPNQPVYNTSGDQMRAMFQQLAQGRSPQAPGVISGAGSDIASGAKQMVGMVANPAQMAGQGDIGGAVGQGAVTVPMFASMIKGPMDLAAKSVSLPSRAASVKATVPEAANLSPQAIAGTERIFRAAAPVGSNPEFRGALYDAAGDLADIGRKVNISEAKGGVIQPDMRVRATVNAINDHLSDMYQQERAPQIARNAENPVPMQFGEDATNGLNFLAQKAAKADLRNLAQKALQATPEKPLTLAETDQLARLVNKEMSPYRGMTPQELALNADTNRNFAGMQALDGELGNSIAQELSRRGEVGIGQYEKRYATLSAVRDQLQSRMNMAELQRKNPVLWAKAMAGGPKGVAGASMAATANVNIGRQLELGLRQLANTELTANKGTATPPPTIKGLLPRGATQMPSPMEPTGQPSAPPPTASTTRAERLGLLLPEAAGGKVPQSAVPVGSPLWNILQKARQAPFPPE